MAITTITPQLNMGYTLNILLSVTYYLELCNAITICCIYHIYQRVLNWLFGHYRTLTTLLGKKNTSMLKSYSIG